MRRALQVALAALGALAVAAAAVAALNLRGEDPVDDDVAVFRATPQQVARGAYLAKAGNCMTCHTARGGPPYAGGRGIDTPFGTVYAGNLTPHEATGLGRWSAGHFWRALHNGRSRDGRLLYPAFPYPNFTEVTREDSDALYAFLRSLPAVDQANRPHALRFPFDNTAAIAVWRALFFSPGRFEPDAARGAEWNRGAYLVRGLGHCNACHAPRNAFGATSDKLELSGGLIPMQQWYAPSLASPHEAGVARWESAQVVALLKAGVANGASVMGPMAEVVLRSTSQLEDADLRAIATYLKALPEVAPERAAQADVDDTLRARGEQVYAQQCAQCHGRRGEGVAGAFPPLAGNRAVTLASPANLVRVLLSGGYPPATAGNPRPFGMPPYAHVLDDRDIAAVITYVRGAWGNDAPAVPPQEVLKYRR